MYDELRTLAARIFIAKVLGRKYNHPRHFGMVPGDYSKITCNLFAGLGRLIVGGAIATMSESNSADRDTVELLRRVERGDDAATQELLERHRDRLRQMISVRVDPRTASRFDASDVIQETLFEASRMLPEYLSKRPLPFYPWLRQIAWQRLAHLQRDHLDAQKRSVKREDPFDLPDRSAIRLAEVVMGSGTSPSGHLKREERRVRVQAALARMLLSDRELLVLRNLEGLSTAETAAVLGISEGAVKTRHFRALARLQNQIGDDFSGGPS